ncbi:hypothetical protein DPEC_G00113070 [Dallia pectoralis]|uniref:Uncharacterized protein n=1 Tax=Dallia pectoralis TaxID=75939 RepID=A0ACC2GTC4_DALPE|nr:hypothetical protein DPEC_G00113070 [Dallia pectoralis]
MRQENQGWRAAGDHIPTYAACHWGIQKPSADTVAERTEKMISNCYPTCLWALLPYALQDVVPRLSEFFQAELYSPTHASTHPRSSNQKSWVEKRYARLKGTFCGGNGVGGLLIPL